MSKFQYLHLTPRFDHESIEIGEFQRKSWPGITAEKYRIRPTSHDFALKEAANFVVLMNMYRTDGETFVDGQSPNRIKDLRNKMTFIPTGASMSGWSQLKSIGTYTALYFDGDSRDEDRAQLAIIPPTAAFEDARLRSTIMAFSAILQDRAVDVAGYAETLGALLIYELNRFSRTSLQLSVLDGGLSQQQVHRAVDYIESKLTDHITIADLADLLGLSRAHFIRAFKRAVGIPPHQFILRRRIERAKELLSENRMSVSTVAHTTGFNGLNQLTRVFRRVVGVTPTGFRREISNLAFLFFSALAHLAI